MNNKKVAVVAAESGTIHDLEIAPGTTAKEIIQQCGLSPAHKLSAADGKNFDSSEVVADQVADGSKLFASVTPEVG